MTAAPQIAPVAVHPAASAFPLLEGAAFAELVEDIRAHGLIQPIILAGEAVLDGRNRLRACEAAGIAPRFETFSGDDPVAFVVSTNLHRRHLTESQRAMVAARLANMPQGARTDLVQICTKSRAEAAELLNVSTRAVASARTVQRGGIAELVAAVDHGNVPVSTAAEIASLPNEEQRAVDLDDKHAIREAILAAAEQGLKGIRAPRRFSRNPLYVDDPAYRMLLNVVGPCRQMMQQVDAGEIDVATILGAFIDAAHRARSLGHICRARDFLTLISEKANVD